MAKKICILLLTIMVIFVALPIVVNQASASSAEDVAEPGSIVTEFQKVLEKIGAKLKKYATSLFISLAILQFAQEGVSSRSGS